MSLLLDALKKAAEDKENAESKGSVADVDKKESKEDVIEDILPELSEELILSEDVLEESVSESATEILEDEILELDLPLDEEVDIEPVQTPEKKVTSEPELPEAIDEKGTSAEAIAPIETKVPEKEEQAEVVIGSSHPEADVETSFHPEQKLPEYNHNDARKILEVSQKRYRNNQRMVYYGLYTFAALLFFAGSYLYYTTEILDNSDRPVFRERNKTEFVAKTEKEIKIEKQVSIAKAKLAELDESARNNTIVEAPIKKVIVNPVKKQQKKTKITIVKQKQVDPISLLLQKAYAYYQASEYDKSKAIYEKILLRDERQRDALLGVAAVAVVTKNYAYAKNNYQQLLRYYPRDSIAKSALVDLERQKFTVANESQLNVLKRENPKAAHVHFSLGLLYAKQNRIKESQQAFFDAFALDKKADYAYNLAVMLDKLGQPKAALSYYKQASSLSDNSVSHFNEKLALERILQLEGSSE